MAFKNPEDKKAYEKRYRAANIERLSAYQKRYREENRKKRSDYYKQHYVKNREKYAAYHARNYRRVAAVRLLRKYGITQGDYNSILKAQGGVCAICSRPETSKFHGKVRALAVDHDHDTGKVRGLLCWACNGSIGKFGDDPQMLDKAAAYLREHRKLALVAQ